MFELVSEGRYSLMRIIDNPFFAFVVYVIELNTWFLESLMRVGFPAIFPEDLVR